MCCYRSGLFSIGAFKTLDISQGSVATQLRRGGIFSGSNYYKFSPDSESEILLKSLLIFGKVEAYKNCAISGPPCIIVS